ncbi:MAG: hypothetical protein GF317_03505 [Candidatus Lokiarchaeota archaeon]|nr:hypothetical protein [Candidatus Lokiarchaeota archaeon]MBD3198962.1 hypothetical protein [Candidatus Lokiarchaeota archaeon]
MMTYNLTKFTEYLIEWAKTFQVDEKPYKFSVKREGQTLSLYGMCDMVYNLTIPNLIQNYISQDSTKIKKNWVEIIQSYQNPKTGWFKEGFFNYGFHFKEHSSAFSVAALKLLDSQPKYPIKSARKLNTRKKVRKWLRSSPEWGLLYWPGSHRGGGIAAIFATLGEEYYPHEDFFDWYFEWLDEKADPEVGFWRIGWIHKLKKDRLTKQELGGAVHYYWIYEFLDHPIPYPEKVIDSTLELQTECGTWDTSYSYCIDLDAIFCLTRCCRQTNGYRKEDIKTSIRRYLELTLHLLNNKDKFYKNYDDAHRLTGCLCAIAEVQKFFPELIKTQTKWIQTLDITPWI